MSNLFSAGLYRLRKSKVFWLALIFMAVISVILCVEMARNAVTDPNITFADGMFSNQAVMNLVMAVFVTLFLGTEYSDRTIRNKIISGHSRSTIYLAAFSCKQCGRTYHLCGFSGNFSGSWQFAAPCCRNAFCGENFFSGPHWSAGLPGGRGFFHLLCHGAGE